MRIFVVTQACLLALAGCSVPQANNSELDMAVEIVDLAGVDFSIAPGSIGAPCQMATDCTQGTAPTCWQYSVLDQPGNLPTANGYCTSTCTTDADCAGTGFCESVLAGEPKYCLRACETANTCRLSDGFACFILTPTTGYCYPSTRLSCNPTMVDPATGNGTCPGASPASACIRVTFEDLGECLPLCQLGVGTCAAANGLMQHCIYLDTTETTSGQPTRDKFKGLACFPVYSDAKTPDSSCGYFEECTDGYECDLVAGGDGKCHQLCTVGTANQCTSPENCLNSFGAGTGNAGLCN
jgi:hypothetical protein